MIERWILGLENWPSLSRLPFLFPRKITYWIGLFVEALLFLFRFVPDFASPHINSRTACRKRHAHESQIAVPLDTPRPRKYTNKSLFDQLHTVHLDGVTTNRKCNACAKVPVSVHATIVNLPGAGFWLDSYFLPCILRLACQTILARGLLVRRILLGFVTRILGLLLVWICFDDQFVMLLILGENLVPDTILSRVALRLCDYPTAFLRRFRWRVIIERTTHACWDAVRRSCGVSKCVISSCAVRELVGLTIASLLHTRTRHPHKNIPDATLTKCTNLRTLCCTLSSK